MQLRPDQQDLDNKITDAWRSHRNVLAVAPCGWGKTVLFSHRIKEHNGASCAIAHRQELVAQISIASAREGVKHRIIGPNNIIRFIVQQHIQETGQSFYDPHARCGVAGVDTLIRRGDQYKSWMEQVTLWIQDEAHHVCKKNKWGKAASMFPNARGLGVTATPLRADGKGLGRHADGLFDTMVLGPTMRDTINAGNLTDYRIFAPPSDLDMSSVEIGTTGDYKAPQVKRQMQKSHVVGDVIAHYLRLAPGKLGVTFATDVETATEIAARYNEAGVPAEVLSAKTPDAIRVAILKRFKAREILQLVSVNIIGEGVDVPAIEVISMARPTMSYGLYVQQFGRALRLLDGKTVAIIIDHVGNVMRHGLPDAPRTWTLDRRERRGSGDRDPNMMPVKTCGKCTGVYEAYHKACPFCGWTPLISARNSIDFVDGELAELDVATLKKMRGEVDRVTDIFNARPLEMAGAPGIAIAGARKQHGLRQAAQTDLREAMAMWGGYSTVLERDVGEQQRRFWIAFGIDVMGAQSLGRPEAVALTVRVKAHTETLKRELAAR